MIPEAIALRINDLVRTRPPDIIADIAHIVEATSLQTWIQARSVVLQSLPYADVRSDVAQCAGNFL